jgi:hypothetical protein
VPNLQFGGQVVSFMTQHLGLPIPSPAIMEKIGTAFRRSVSRFAEDEHIQMVHFKKGDRKIELMRRYLVAQEAHWSFRCRSHRGGAGVPERVRRQCAAGFQRRPVVLLQQG